MDICHFFHVECVAPMNLSLHVFWSMPCHLYRGVFHVFLWSMWWLAQACKLGFVMFLFSGTGFTLFLLLFCCHVSMCLQRDPCFIWVCLVRMFCIYSCALSIHAPVCNYGVPSLSQSCSTFAIKYFWQNVNMIFNFAKVVVVDPYMLWTCSCHG